MRLPVEKNCENFRRTIRQRHKAVLVLRRAPLQERKEKEGEREYRKQKRKWHFDMRWTCRSF